MIDIILGFMVVILSLVGAVSIVRFLLFGIYKSSKDKTIMLITPASSDCEDIEYTLRSCAVKVRWMGKVRPYMVVCLDNGMDDITREICTKICSEYEFMTIMKTDELTELFGVKESNNSYIE
ncbi:MAG: hypothetical protein IJ298_08275 [Ruminococcus sp.]|nr:hypothetical protein [Ruminococcus sp.]